MQLIAQALRPTKELILNRVSEERLMEHYLGITPRKGLFKSPLRKDGLPTCSFYRNAKGSLIFKDFSGDFYGTAFDVVMRKYNCSYYKALQIIANDFNIINRKDLKINKAKVQYSNTTFEEEKSAIIQIQIRDFTKEDLQYWLNYGIKKEVLEKFNVYSCKNIFLNRTLFHAVGDKELVFGYFGGVKNEIEQWRCYYPNRKKYRFISNWRSNQLQGAAQLPREGGEYLIVTKSLKDIMVLYNFEIPSIAPISENLFVTDAQYKKLKDKFEKIIVFFDNDRTGLFNMNKIRKQYPEVIVTFIPKSYKVKDISDFYKKYGHYETFQLINQFKDYIDGKTEEKRN